MVLSTALVAKIKNNYQKEFGNAITLIDNQCK